MQAYSFVTFYCLNFMIFLCVTLKLFFLSFAPNPRVRPESRYGCLQRPPKPPIAGFETRNGEGGIERSMEGKGMEGEGKQGEGKMEGEMEKRGEGNIIEWMNFRGNRRLWLY